MAITRCVGVVAKGRITMKYIIKFKADLKSCRVIDVYYLSNGEWGPEVYSTCWPESVMVFDTVEEARAEALEFFSEPIDVCNCRDLEILEVEPNMVQRGWKLVKE